MKRSAFPQQDLLGCPELVCLRSDSAKELRSRLKTTAAGSGEPLATAQLGTTAADAAVPARRSGNRPGGQAPVSAPRACLFGSQLFAGFALDVAGGAVLLPGFHIADEIVRRASRLAHGESLIGSAAL